VGEKKFLINASWWRKWCDYVNLKCSEEALDLSRASVGDYRFSEEQVTFYDKPSKINNRRLLDINDGLCRNLVEHFDYVVIDKSVWLHLSSWYQFDVKICRRLICDP
jgi:hypothetical protein